MKNKTQKRPLISAIIGISIALFTIVCCGLLVPLGLFTAAAFLHQWRIPLIILGIATAVISIFFLLKGKEIICVCKVLDIMRKHKKLLISLLGIILCASLISVFLSGNFFRPSTSDSTGMIRAEWKNSKADSDLVRVVNFLEENIGKEIELAEEKQVITGREALSIKIIMLECCTKGEFAEILNNISKIGKVKASDFSKKEIFAELPANEIPKIAEIWNVETISLELESKILRESIIKGF
ncbi:MAG: hypothetical protein KJ821_08085 [Actinobacteria bacterium]|nr:hypothetical protein [Actinomycetota bacterium]